MMKSIIARDDENDYESDNDSVHSDSYDDADFMTNDRNYDDVRKYPPAPAAAAAPPAPASIDLDEDSGFAWNKISNGSQEEQIAEMKNAVIQLQEVISNLIEFDRPIEGGFRKTRMRKRFNRKTKGKKSRKGRKGKM